MSANVSMPRSRAGWRPARARDEIAGSRLFYRAAPTSWPRQENVREHEHRRTRALAASDSFKSHYPRRRSQITHNHRAKGKNTRMQRRYPIGAEIIGANETHFRVWAPKAKRVDVVLEASAAKDIPRTFHPLQHEKGGYFSGLADAGADGHYRFRVDGGEDFYPDPAS